MGRRFRGVFVACAASAALGGPLVTSSPAAGMLDQAQTDAGQGGLGISGTSLTPGESLAQTFQAGLSGALGEIDIYASRRELVTQPVTVEIRDADAGGPGAHVLATQAVPVADVPASAGGWVPVVFSAPPSLHAGTQYAIVVFSDTPRGADYYWWVGSGDPYALGTGWSTRDSQAGSPTGSWGRIGSDLAFRTYVAPLAPTSVGQCKANGWERYGAFENQGGCVSSVVGRRAP